MLVNFMLLGQIVMKLSGLTLRRQGMQAAVLCVLYAASDELHQYFVPGRAALVGDVVIDALGILPSVAGVCLLVWLHQKQR